MTGELLLLAIRREATTIRPLRTAGGHVIGYGSGESPYFHAHIEQLRIRRCAVGQADAAWAVRAAAGQDQGQHQETHRPRGTSAISTHEVVQVRHNLMARRPGT